MKKELIFAIIFGIILGLIITYGVYRSKNIKKTDDPTITETLNDTTQDVNSNKLVLQEPADEIVTENQNITVSGSTLANNFVIVFVGNQETITKADESGNFSVKVKLDSGANVITVYSIDEDDQQSKIDRTVVLNDSSFSIKTTEEASASAQTATKSAKTSKTKTATSSGTKTN